MKFTSSIFLAGAFAASSFSPTDAGLATKAAKSLLMASAKAAGGKLGETGAGYALSAIGMGGGKYTDQLNEIQNTLTSIDQDLSSILDEMGQWQCDSMSAQLIEAEAAIDKRMEAYNFYLTQAENGHMSQSRFTCTQNDEGVCVRTWAKNVLEGDTESSLSKYLSEIHKTLIDHRLIQKCVNAYVQTPQQYQFDDEAGTPDRVSNYWEDVYEFMAYYYNIQAKAATAILEAYPFRAWRAAGYPKIDFDTQEEAAEAMNAICSNSTVGVDGVSPNDYCIASYSEVRKIRYNIVEQYEVVGAPYGNNETKV
ncbi:MAG: hypothetical protein SGARI_000811, partial [Bacillariaceae sp.]